MPWPQAQLGLMEELTGQAAVVAGQRRLPLLNDVRGLMGRCTTCSYRSTCGGGCVAVRQRLGADGEDAYCDHRMRMIDGLAAILAQPGWTRGAWCRTARWRPRTPNSMRDVTGFLSRWNQADTARRPARLKISAHGNINTVGKPGIHEADDLDPAHPQWGEAIEPGARPLVDVFTQDWRLVTYDSCQGHSYAGLDLPPVERRVGLLLRRPEEYAQVAAALCRTVTTVTPLLPPSVQVTVGRSELLCETSGKPTPTLDLALRPAPGTDWTPYFAALDQATAHLVGALREESPVTTAGCSCPLPTPEATVVAEGPA
ncbi:hypothetical protein [Streptomyces sp. MJP52]|uniref:hypothetical protein n=1 Tax=Streptomyces sp. MJP52 TaxID=2940555 RepID=UPI002475B104|nr:hypothetical protein [Streptomyces sp. MJP52]MDH6223674.1 hypothetical protein [Streptomyces sp. MJP52]